jgi:hypothetical protein
MLGVFSKPLETLTPADIGELCEQAWPEGYQVEFKRSLPNKKETSILGCRETQISVIAHGTESCRK